jgi:hypothetical protein
MVFVFPRKIGSFLTKGLLLNLKPLFTPFHIPYQILNHPMAFFFGNMGKCFPLIRAKLINLDLFKQLVQHFANNTGQHFAFSGA